MTSKITKADSKVICPCGCGETVIARGLRDFYVAEIEVDACAKLREVARGIRALDVHAAHGRGRLAGGGRVMWAIKDNESGQIGSVEMTEAEARDWLVKFANTYGTGFGARFVPVKVS